MTELQTPRLHLRPHRIEDFAHVQNLWGNPEVTRWITGKPSTREESWARLLRYIGHWQALNHGFFTVFDKASGTFLGEVGIADFKRDMTPSLEGFAEAGWVMLPEAWGKGIATEALTAVMDWYRKTANPPRNFTCIITPENAASVALAKRCGFTEHTQGTYHDETVLVMRAK